MKTEIYLQIPKPCHENWDAMMPVDKGKFCSACSKEVVDFSLLSDAEVVNYFKKSTGNTCGRFYGNQLERPLEETKIEKKKNWKYMLACITSIIMMSRSSAQKKQDCTALQGEIKIERLMREPNIDSVAPHKLQTASTVIMGATLSSQTLQSFIVELPPVTVIGYKSVKGKVMMGAVVACIKPPKKDTIVASFRNILSIIGLQENSIKIYPNPAERNSVIHITTNESANYQVQLFDNASRLLHTEESNVIDKRQVINFSLPGNMAAGFYYVRLINRQTTKTYTSKLIVR